MKQFWREVGFAVVLGMLMPGVILNIITFSAHQRATEIHHQRPTEYQQVNAFTIKVLSGDGSVQEMELETYLVGVVLAEMPATFEVEALKAQAVVARTYTLRSRERKKHDNADVCTDSTCCQAYSVPELLKIEGIEAEDFAKICNAVEETSGQILTYNGEIIEATYYSCSGGMTEDALAVWGTDIPYLQSVSSPGEENAVHFEDSVSFAPEQLCGLLGLPINGQVEFEDMTFTTGGGVKEVAICGVKFQGTEIRKLLNLRSTAFTITNSDNEVTFHTRGYGHRVGMSQYGADAMAVLGSSYREILQHYYPGTILENRSIDKLSAMG